MTTSSSSPAKAVIIFMIEPGGLETRKALLRNGLDLSAFNLFHSLLDIGC